MNTPVPGTPTSRRSAISRALTTATAAAALLSLVLVVAVGAAKGSRRVEIVVDATVPPGTILELSVDPTLEHFMRAGPARGGRERFVFRPRTHQVPFIRLDTAVAPGTVALHSLSLRAGRRTVTFTPGELGAWRREGVDRAELAGDGSLAVTSAGSDPRVVSPPLAAKVRARGLARWLISLDNDAVAGLLVLAVLAFLVAQAATGPRPGGERTRLRDRVLRPDVLVPLLAFTALMALHGDFVPLWDGMWYVRCVDDAVASGGIGKLNCLGYDSYPYMALLAAPVALLGRSYAWVHLVNWACGVFAVFLFHRLFLALRGERAGRAEALVATTLFAVNPLFVVSALNLNFDFPVLVAGLAFTLAWILRMPRLAAVAGLLLCFSKITGAAVYFAFLGGFAVLSRVVPVRASRWEKLLLLVPGAAFAAVQLLHRVSGTRADLPEGVRSSRVVDLLLSLDLSSPRLHRLLAGISSLNFTWALVPFAAAALAIVVAACVSPRLRARLGAVDRSVVAVCAAFAASVYVASRVFLYFNPRYFLLAHVLFLLLGTVCWAAVVPWQRAKLAFGAALVLLALASNFATLDPVSKRIFGTFRFGDHELLPLGRIDDMDPGRDQLVYSPQITVVHRLLEDVYRAVRPDAGTLMVASHLSNAHHFAHVSREDFSRRPFRSQGFPVLHATVEEVTKLAPARFVLLTEPYFGSDRLPDRVPAGYRAVARERIVRRGYGVDVIRYERATDVAMP